MRYKVLESMHIGVELLYNHGGTSGQDVTNGLPTLTVNDSGKVSIEKIRKDDLVFQMNATLRKVLREVRMGLLIIEPNVRGDRINRGRR